MADRVVPAEAPRTAISVNIAGRTLGILLAVAAAVWLAGRLSHLLLLLLFAVLLATAIDAPVTWLQRRGLPRPAGILLHFLLLLALLGVVVLVLIPLVASEARLLRTEAPAYADQLEAWIGTVNPSAAGSFSFDRIAAEASGNLGGVATRLTAVGVEIGRTLLYAFVTLVLAFFLAADPGVGKGLVARLAPPSQQARIDAMAATTRLRIGAWARGQVTIALLFGLAMGVGLELLDVPYAVSLGVAAGVLELLPYVGGAITVVLATLTALSVGVPQAIGVVVLYLILVNLESHVLAPLLFGKAIGLPPVAILVALLAGVDLLGIAGALLAIPLTVILWVVADELLPRREVGSTAAPSSPDPTPDPIVVASSAATGGT